MFGSSLSPVVCGRVDVFFGYLCLFTYSGIHPVLTIRVTWQVSYRWHGLLNVRGHLGSSPVFGTVRVALLFSFLCCVFVFCLSSSCVLCAQCCQCF